MLIPGSRFRYLRWAAVALVIAVIGVGGAALVLPSTTALSSERGFLEITSCFFWLVAALAAGATIFRWSERADRLTGVWMGCVALLACLRELDAHIYLNPDYFGRFGVRYRVDWWLDGNVSLWLKLGWASVAIVLLGVLLYIPLTVRLPLFQMARRGEPMVGLFFLAILLLGMGFVLDDLLRGARFVPRDVKKIMEETSELLGATAFFASAWLRWRFPLAAHLKTASIAGRT